jgi:O-antigen/teichoic acid export membrane protein
VRADPTSAIRIAGQSIRRGLLLSVAAASVLIITAPLLCVTVFGEDFRGSIDDLRVLALGGVGIATSVLLGNALIAQRRPLLAAAADATALVVTLALDILLIPSLGGLGAAIATTVAYGVGSVVLTVVFVRLLGGRARDLVPRFGDLAWYSRQAGALLAVVPRRGVAR